MTRNIVAGVAVLALLAVAGVEALRACSCAPPPGPKVALGNASAVFTGKVIKIAPDGDFQRAVTFAVDKQWKGIDRAEVTVTTANDGATCGYGFQKDQSYLVYCYSPPNEKKYFTNICTRTTSLANAKADLAELGPGAAPTNTKD